MYIQICFIIILFYLAKFYRTIEVYTNLIDKSNPKIIFGFFYLIRLGILFLFGIISYSLFDINLHIPILLVTNMFFSIIISHNIICFLFRISFNKMEFLHEIFIFGINLSILLIQIM
jgi:hypothetical protein